MIVILFSRPVLVKMRANPVSHTHPRMSHPSLQPITTPCGTQLYDVHSSVSQSCTDVLSVRRLKVLPSRRCGSVWSPWKKPVQWSLLKRLESCFHCAFVFSLLYICFVFTVYLFIFVMYSCVFVMYLLLFVLILSCVVFVVSRNEKLSYRLYLQWLVCCVFVDTRARVLFLTLLLNSFIHCWKSCMFSCFMYCWWSCLPVVIAICVFSYY